jgi:activating signal cointegrator complex subunit 2
MSDGTAHGSLLLDHLYFLKSEAEKKTKGKPTQATLCSSLVCTTSFLKHLAADGSITSGKRGQDLLDALTAYRQNTAHLHPPAMPRRRKVAKGKGKASNGNTHEEMHVHQASQVSQVHDLFPDLPNHYILRLLDHFHDDTEAAIAALLEPASLPADLREPGPSDGLPTADLDGPTHDLAPHATPPLPPQRPPRKNVFDGDDFDNLRVPASRLHRGRKEVTIDDAGGEDERTRRKAAIMTALAAFDSDDDERDDTYDVADVGGTVDSTLDTDRRPRPPLDQTRHEESLFRAWKGNQELFARDSKTRSSKVRQDLKRETGMSDEQLEGWAIVLQRDPKLQDRLEGKSSHAPTFRGNQPALAPTRWQGDGGGTPDDSEEGEAHQGPSSGRRTGPAQIRGDRSWGGRGDGRGGGRGGGTAGPGSDASTQAARRRKEQGRGRGGANHNRREGRARKIGRGMAGPAG